MLHLRLGHNIYNTFFFLNQVYILSFPPCYGELKNLVTLHDIRRRISWLPWKLTVVHKAFWELRTVPTVKRSNYGENTYLSKWMIYFRLHTSGRGTAVPQWLRSCATNRKVAGLIPAGVNGFFIDIKFFRSHYGPGVDSASNRNEYREYFLGVKTAGA